MPQHSMSQVGVQQLVPLLMVKSMDASLAFYIDGLGFTMTNKWTPEGRIRWCWLEHGTAALMLQEFAPHGGGRSELEGNLGAGVGLNFMCADALAFYHVVQERGIAVNRPFVGNRLWVTSLRDPDGYSLHFESPTDTPEETVYG
jgi:lactoylglutathione lyase